MSKESSFDIVSKVDLSEVTNAVNIALKEIQNRYDFKGSKSDISLEKDELILISDDEFKLEQLKDVLIGKLIKRGVPTKNIQYRKIEPASGGTVRQRAKLVQGIDKDNAKKINTIIKNTGLKVKSQNSRRSNSRQRQKQRRFAKSDRRHPRSRLADRCAICELPLRRSYAFFSFSKKNS